MVREVAAAIAFLHENGVAHRDLKPQNVLCVRKNEVGSKGKEEREVSKGEQMLFTPFLPSPPAALPPSLPTVLPPSLTSSHPGCPSENM